MKRITVLCGRLLAARILLPAVLLIACSGDDSNTNPDADAADAPDQGSDVAEFADTQGEVADAQSDVDDDSGLDVTDPDVESPPANTAEAFAACVREVADARIECAGDGDLACWQDVGVLAAADPLRSFTETQAIDGIPDAERFSANADETAISMRRVDWCREVVEATFARSLGGPHAALLTESEAGNRCLRDAYYAGIDAFLLAMEMLWTCRDGGCSAEEIGEGLAAAVDETAIELGEQCNVRPQLGIGPRALLGSAAEQAECAFAALYPGHANLPLRCGPRPAVIGPEQDEWIEVVFEEEEWGTRCADGSDYSFWFRPAPEGHPLDRIIIDMQGGGVCLFDDCIDSYENRFQRWISSDSGRPTSDRMATGGENPFRDWSMLRLPYCTQDIFAGNGTVEQFGDVTVHRYGAVNMRAATRYARDALWHLIDETTDDGYRAAEFQVHLTGESAGGFGDAINYHYVVDEIGWRDTSMAPTGALALDGGDLPLPTLGTAKCGAWGLDAVLPPYCRTDECVTGPTMIAAHAQRFGTTPHQRALIASTQNDHVQVNTTLFGSQTDWINTGRQAFCDMRDIPNVFFFLAPTITERHDVRYSSEAGGLTFVEWLTDAWDETPGNISHAVDEGGMAAAISGVEEFPCEL